MKINAIAITVLLLCVLALAVRGSGDSEQEDLLYALVPELLDDSYAGSSDVFELSGALRDEDDLENSSLEFGAPIRPRSANTYFEPIEDSAD